jgi:hypothetical protein
MSPSGDRVAVPTNGHRPPLSDPEVEGDLAGATDLDADDPAVESTGPSRIGVALSPPPVSPGQLAAGLGIVAGLILLILGTRRPRRR